MSLELAGSCMSRQEHSCHPIVPSLPHHPLFQTDANPHHCVFQTQCRWKCRVPTSAVGAELPSSSALEFGYAENRKELKSSPVCSPTMVKMKNQVTVFRYNMQLLKEIKGRRSCDPSQQLPYSLENCLSLREFLLPSWQEDEHSWLGAGLMPLFSQNQRVSPKLWTICLQIFQNCHYKEIAFR